MRGGEGAAGLGRGAGGRVPAGAWGRAPAVRKKGKRGSWHTSLPAPSTPAQPAAIVTSIGGTDKARTGPKANQQRCVGTRHQAWRGHPLRCIPGVDLVPYSSSQVMVAGARPGQPGSPKDGGLQPRIPSFPAPRGLQCTRVAQAPSMHILLHVVTHSPTRRYTPWHGWLGSHVGGRPSLSGMRALRRQYRHAAVAVPVPVPVPTAGRASAYSEKALHWGVARHSAARESSSMPPCGWSG